MKGCLLALVLAAATVVFVGWLALRALEETFPPPLPDNALERPYDTTPTWSADGRRVAFLRHDDGETHLVIADVASTEQDGLGRAAWSSSITWSPDGSRIAFASDRDGVSLKPCPEFHSCGEWATTELYVVEVATEDAARLTTNTADDIEPAWSPDGSRIAFLSGRARRRDEHIARDVYVLDVESGRTRRITHDAEIEDSVSWLDARRLYASYEDGSAASIDVESGAIHDAAPPGGDPWKRTERAHSARGAVALTTARDRNGRTCSYDSGPGPCTANRELYVKPRGASKARRITHTKKDEYDLAWSPDGRVLAFASGERIWLVNDDATSLRRLSG